MQLAFDQNGNVLTSAGEVTDITGTNLEELYRMNSFFGISRGSYIFDKLFGHRSMNIVGKSNISPTDLSKFIEKLRIDFIDSNLLVNTNYEISYSMKDKHTLKFNIKDGNTGRFNTWEFGLKTGRLSKVDKISTLPSERTYEVVSESFTAEGSASFDLSNLYSTMLLTNKLGEFDNFETQYRIYSQSTTSSTKRLVSINEFDINLIDLQLNFYVAPPEGYIITIEFWPSPMVNLSVTDNPYMNRKYK